MRFRPLVRVILLAILVVANVAYFYISRLSPPIASSSTSLPLINETLKFHPYGDGFCVAFNAINGTNNFRQDGLEPISLAVHMTTLYMKYVNEQINTWDGPISLAVFIDRQSAHVVQLMLNIHKCFPDYAAKMTLHFVYRQSAFGNDCETVPLSFLPCSKLTTKYVNKVSEGIIPPFGIYPINVVRNVARKGALSDIHIIADIEMIFSRNFAIDVKPIANKLISKDSKKLLVVRRFELETKAKSIPRTLLDLKRRFYNKTAFEFHHKLFPLGHTIPALHQWFKISEGNKSTIYWNIKYKSPSWEPQMIMHSSAPYSEEFMPTRIRDHQALTYELCRANYTFYILSRHFNIHRGVKKVMTNVDVAVKTHQMRLRPRTHRAYIGRINRMYPDTKEQCGNFTM